MRVAPRAHRHTISKLQFLDERPREDTPVTQFDIVFSQDSMEHFRDPGAVLAQMKRALSALEHRIVNPEADSTKITHVTQTMLVSDTVLAATHIAKARS